MCCSSSSNWTHWYVFCCCSSSSRPFSMEIQTHQNEVKNMRTKQNWSEASIFTPHTKKKQNKINGFVLTASKAMGIINKNHIACIDHIIDCFAAPVSKILNLIYTWIYFSFANSLILFFIVRRQFETIELLDLVHAHQQQNIQRTDLHLRNWFAHRVCLHLKFAFYYHATGRYSMCN